MLQQEVHQGEMAHIGRLRTAIVFTPSKPALDGRPGTGTENRPLRQDKYKREFEGTAKDHPTEKATSYFRGELSAGSAVDC